MKTFCGQKLSFPLFVIFLLLTNSTVFSQIDCNTTNRYREDVLTIQDLDTFSLVYANYTSGQLWNNGDTSTNSNCFDPRNYLSALPNGTWDIRMKVYHPKLTIDQCQSKAAIVFTHGGGYAYLATGIEGNGVIGPAVAMALKGYVVVTLDYRKGWDIRDAKNVTGLGPLLSGCQSCPCENGNSNCDPFTFTKMNYMMMQDTRAAHRKLLTLKDSLKVDENKIFYMSSSTGSVGAMHAAFAADDFGSFLSPNGIAMDQILGTPDAVGVSTPPGATFKIAGISTHAGAIHDLSWIENNDDIPLCMIHGTLDEAVKYCAGNILDMKYFTTNSSTYLSLQGPGKIYKSILCNDDGSGTQTKIRLHSFQGLYHNMCAPLGSTDPTDNCDTINSAEKLFGFSARFYADIIDFNGINNQHMYAASASSQSQCNVSDSNYYTPCTGFTPCNLGIDELGKSELLIYPNRVSKGEFIHFELANNKKIDHVKIYNALGTLVQDEKLGKTAKVQISLPVGLYYVNASVGDKSYLGKLMVE